MLNDSLIELVKFLKADRITQHIPLVSVDTSKRDPVVLEMRPAGAYETTLNVFEKYKI